MKIQSSVHEKVIKCVEKASYWLWKIVTNKKRTWFARLLWKHYGYTEYNNRIICCGRVIKTFKLSLNFQSDLDFQCPDYTQNLSQTRTHSNQIKNVCGTLFLKLKSFRYYFWPSGINSFSVFCFEHWMTKNEKKNPLH